MGGKITKTKCTKTYIETQNPNIILKKNADEDVIGHHWGGQSNQT